MQSSTAGQSSAQKAVDGNTSPYFQASTCTMTDVEHKPWWYVNLLEPYLVQIVRIDFGTACCSNRQKAVIAVRVGNNRPDLGNNPLCNRYEGFIEEGKPLFLPCTRPTAGAFVSIHLESPGGSALSICETFIYTDHALSIEQCPSFRDQPLGSTATYNGKCYIFHNNLALNFEQARKQCDLRGGSLVDETSPALQGFLSWELYRRHRNDQLMGQYWLGAVRDSPGANQALISGQRNSVNSSSASSTGGWRWINGKELQISFWSGSLGTANCSRFDGSKGWLWSDTDCQSSLNFICQHKPLTCGKPERSTNSTLISRSIDNNTTTVIEYQCSPGNLLMGPRSRTCLTSGFYSEYAPKCKYLDCQMPAMIANGDYKLLNGTTSYLSVVHYFCHDGFQLHGKGALSCDVDERWNGPPPRCEPLLCPSPEPPVNGYVMLSNNLTLSGSQATFECRAPQYELIGERLLTCLPSGSWDSSFPYCRERPRATPFQQVVAPAQPPLQQPQQPVSFAVNQQRQQQLSANNNNKSTGSSSMSITTSSPTVNGNQQVAANSAATGVPNAGASTSTTTLQPTATSTASSEQSARKMAQSSSVSQFIQPPPVVAPTSQPPVAPPVQPQPQPEATTSDQLQVVTTTARSRLLLPGISGEPEANGSGQVAVLQSTGSPPVVATMMSSPTRAQPGNGARFALPSVTNYQQVAQPNSPLLNQQQQVVSYESTPAATSNSLLMTIQTARPNLLMSSNEQQQQQPSASTVGGPNLAYPAHHLTATGGAGGFAGGRSPNTLAATRYSLDGIIAVAIFGGFIFLGAIVTIIVVLIRRKSSGETSPIEAQNNQSGYDAVDSNEHSGGLYRNYQQAWENLRFGRNHQPKSSGGDHLVEAHLMTASSTGANANQALTCMAAVPIAPSATLSSRLGNGGASSTTSGSSSRSGSETGTSSGGSHPPLIRSRQQLDHQQQLNSTSTGRRLNQRFAQQQQPPTSSDENLHDDHLDENHQLRLPLHQSQVMASNHHLATGGSSSFRDSEELTVNSNVQTTSSTPVDHHHSARSSTNNTDRQRHYSISSTATATGRQVMHRPLSQQMTPVSPVHQQQQASLSRRLAPRASWQPGGSTLER